MLGPNEKSGLLGKKIFSWLRLFSKELYLEMWNILVSKTKSVACCGKQLVLTAQALSLSLSPHVCKKISWKQVCKICLLMKVLTQDLGTAGFNSLLFWVLPEGLYVRFERRTEELSHRRELEVVVSEVSCHVRISVKDHILWCTA